MPRRPDTRTPRATPGPVDGHEVLLTGVTGFVGKVVLETMLRRRDELGIARVHVLIRATEQRSASERFAAEVSESPCFAGLPDGWTDHVSVVEGDIVRAHCGIDISVREDLAARVTQVLHAAASIDFHLPIADAAEVNVGGALMVLDLARELPRLERMVVVSTAYVAPHTSNDVEIPEMLVALPRPAGEIYDAIRAGTADQQALLSETGHPNTYTYTKCLAEHLLCEHRGGVPLSIVRPSIVSVSHRYPFPGWIDSRAAFAVFTALVGSGLLRTLITRDDARISLVPVDSVAERLVYELFDASARPDEVRIRHAVAGEQAPTALQCQQGVVNFFRRHPFAMRPKLNYAGPSRWRYLLSHVWHHELRIPFGSLLMGRGLKKGMSVVGKVRAFDRLFPYFTSNTFNFVTTDVGIEQQPGPVEYLELICRGSNRHLFGKDESLIPLAGRRGPANGGDLRFVCRRAGVGVLTRLGAWVVTKALRRCANIVTIDVASFERVRTSTPAGTATVLAPSHRSYLDFVLCSYIAFARPDFGIAMPHIAAAREFSRIPVLGHLMRRFNAFYVDRGRGAEDPELTHQVHNLVRSGSTLEFFVEGTRSRTRAFLPPKRGFLKSLQSSPSPVSLVPVAISYERVPEEATFVRELAGEQRPPMRVRQLVGWAVRVLRGKVQLGRIHIAAGTPIVLDAAGDPEQIASELVAELQRATVVTTLHVEAFLDAAPELGMSVADMVDALELRGCRVLPGVAPLERVVDPRIRATLCRQLEPWFHREIRAMHGRHPVASDYLMRWDRHGHESGAAVTSDLLRTRAIVRAVLEPIVRDYLAVVAAATAARDGATLTLHELLRVDDRRGISNIEGALEALAAEGVLMRTASGWRVRQDQRAALARCRTAWASPWGSTLLSSVRDGSHVEAA